MSAGSSLHYRLRPNKAVDRELFLSLLTRLAPGLSLEDYHYIGLGGPLLEDFRLMHARLGIHRMTCVESEREVHKRQIFNRPIASISCVHSSIEDFLDACEYDEPTIVWLDYTDPRTITTQIERFSQTIGTVPIRSVLRVTLNANPSSLGHPDPDEFAVEGEDNDAGKPTIHQWRLERFKERLDALFPNGLGPEGMTSRNYGSSVLLALKLAVERGALSYQDRRIVWALATHYADGQAMVTGTLIVSPADDTSIEDVVNGWEFHSTPDAPHRLDVPALSTLERLTMETSADARSKLGFDLPKSDLGEGPFEAFKKFYRIYPHFSRVEI